MLYEVMRSVNNYFEIPGAGKTGVWSVEDGTIALDFLQEGQYFLIEGSVFNDGLHKYQAKDLEDETFDGAIYPLAVPKAFLDLVEDIEDWETKYGGIAIGPYSSESFAGYSYTKAKSGTADGSNGATWEAAYGSKLSTWRKL